MTGITEFRCNDIVYLEFIKTTGGYMDINTKDIEAIANYWDEYAHFLMVIIMKKISICGQRS